MVNTYAMNFVVPVPAYIADLEFSWQSLAGHSVCITIIIISMDCIDVLRLHESLNECMKSYLKVDID